jgi:hypothetical protein
VSAFASFILIAIGLAADISRRQFTGVKRFALNIAALMPTGVVLALAMTYAWDLLSVTGSDGMSTDSLIKLSVPVLTAAAGHITIFLNSEFFVAALDQREEQKLHPRLMALFAKLRALAQDYVAAFKEQQRATTRLAQLGATSMTTIEMPPQAKQFYAVALMILKPGDPIEILIEIRKMLHPDSGTVDHSPTDDDDPPPSGGGSSDSIDDEDVMPTDSHRRNGTVTQMVMMGALAGALVMPPIVSANPSSGRFSGPGLENTTGAGR